MKVAVILDDSGFSDIDLSHPENGNPGIGGTWFEMGMLLRFLPKKKEIDSVIAFHKRTSNKLPDNIDAVIYGSIKQMAESIREKEPNIVIVRNDMTYAKALEEIEQPFILWAHNFLAVETLPILMSFRFLRRIVFVGKEQYDRYIDHPIIQKCTYVYNMFECDREEYKRNKDFPLWVTYTGSLKREKGFHILAKHWQKIVGEVPEAQLHIIGSGRVYDRFSDLGSYNITDKVYENRFMKYLLDDNGRILSSVFFHGIMGQEKTEVYRKSAVGVVNPTAETETFCLSAVEMSAFGIPIVTKRAEGFLDTVPNGVAGLTFQKERDFPKLVITLLKNRKKNMLLGNSGKRYVRQMFSPNALIEKWCLILSEAGENKTYELEYPIRNYLSHAKWIRIVIFQLRRVPGFGNIPSIQKLDRLYLMGKVKFGLRRIIKGI